jgi:hypothetical protein
MESELTRMHNKDGAFDNFDFVSDSQVSILEHANEINSQGGSASGSRYKTFMNGPSSKTSFSE